MIHRHRIRIGSSVRTVRVWLPVEPPHGVLFLLDGQNVFSRKTSSRPSWNADLVARELIARAAIPPIAIVGLHAAEGTRRWEEYLPYPDPYNAGARRFAADRFADVVVPAAMRAVGERHPALARARRLAIGGSSYGAIGALHTALRHPRRFHGVLIESAPLWVGEGRLIEDARDARPRSRFWIGVGTHETRTAAKSAELVHLARRLAVALRPSATVRLRIASRAPHHEIAWSARLPGALRWLFGS